MLSDFNLSSSCSLLSNLNLHNKSSKFVAREAFRSLRALKFLISFDFLLMTFYCSWINSRRSWNEGESESLSLTLLYIPLAMWHIFDDDEAPLLVQVVVLLMDSSLELVLGSSSLLTHSPRKTQGSFLGFFSFFCFFFFMCFLSTFWGKLDGKILNSSPLNREAISKGFNLSP